MSGIAALNPARTVLVRGQLRPGVVVEENELLTSFTHTNTFVLRWTDGHGGTDSRTAQYGPVDGCSNPSLTVQVHVTVSAKATATARRRS